jgi:hypothetical protein
MLRLRGQSKARNWSKSEARMSDEDGMSEGGETGRGSPKSTVVMELEQVPSQYVYQDGKEITGGVRVDAGDGMVRGDGGSGDVEELQQENVQLMTEMVEMREEMRKVKKMVVGLQMSQSVLISHHNVHTALLEQHWQALANITSHPPTPRV